MQKLNSYWLVFISLALAIMMVDIDTTAVNLAVSTIIKELNLTLSQGQWLINGYTMMAAAFMAFAGRMGDLIGYRKVMLYAFAFFLIASLIVGLANNFPTLLIGRLLQGLCVAFIFPLAIALVRIIFPEKQRGLGISLLISIAGVSQALGPTLGGVLIEFSSWRSIFFINVPLSILAFFMLYKFGNCEEKKLTVSIEYKSLFPLVLGLFSLMTAFNEVNQLGIYSASFSALLLISIISLSVFIYIELTGKSPLLNLKLLLSHCFSALLMVRLIVNFTYFSLLFGLSLVLRDSLHYSALHAGFILLSLTLIIAFLSVPTGKLIDKIGPFKPLLAGCIILLLSCIALSFNDSYQNLLCLMIILFVTGSGVALLIPSSTTAAMLAITPEQTGSAMGVFATFGFIGNSFGVAISGSLMAHYLPLTGFIKAMTLCAAFFILAIILTIYAMSKHKEPAKIQP